MQIQNFLNSLHQLDWFFIISLSGVILSLLLIFLTILLFIKNEKLRKLNTTVKKLNRSFDKLDEQAKLIVKTDLDLNRAQEQLDRRLNALEALQKTSRLISTTLDENEIFHRLNQPLMRELGFERSLVFTHDKDHNLECRVKSGFTDEEIEFILSHLEHDTSLNEALKAGHTFSSITAPAQRREQIMRIFDLKHFILTPILTQNGIIGTLFVGNRSDKETMTEGEEELVSILANQMGQSIENARLFEQVFRSSQMLEVKVRERTKQLASALEEVQHTSKAKTDFVSAVSHELRTPLTSIKGYASLLILGKVGEIPTSVKDRLEKINTHSDNLVKLINDLLDISRIESGRVEMQLLPHDLSGIIENVHDLLIPQIKEKNLTWVVEIAPETPKVKIDKTQIERAFINLVSNAIKFTPLKGVLTVRIRPENGHVLCEVADTGIGIPPEDIPKLFHEFYRSQNAIQQNIKGTGLGLALVKNIIEAHKGKIWVTSEVDEGTTFHLTLPLNAQVEETPLPEAKKEE